MRVTIPREYHIPKNSIKVAHKHSDAVAYLFTTHRGQPAMCVFYGKQSKPVARYSYANEAARAQRLENYFKHRQDWLTKKAEQRAERNNKPRKTEVGAVYYTSWGYEQTNIDWYEVVELVGKTSARVRKIGAIDASQGGEPYMTGKCVPDVGNYTRGEAKLVRVRGDSFKIDGHYASRWDGRPKNWTAYH